MTTLVRTLSEADRRGYQLLRSICRRGFLDGSCYAFATALHEGTGWPMVGLMDGAVIRHAAVRRPDGKLQDARGAVSEAEFGRPFGFVGPYDLRPISVPDLVRDGESTEARAASVRMARKMAEVLWPELPWKDTFAARATAFADELEAVSRKYGLWIRSIVPAAAPALASGDGDEGGYAVRPTVDGLAFTINRYFPD